MVTDVLLKVALIWATATVMLRRILRFFVFATFTDSNLLRGYYRAEPARLTGKPNQLAEILHALLSGDRLLRALPGSGIGACALASDRETDAMPDSAIALNVAQPSHVLL